MQNEIFKVGNYTITKSLKSNKFAVKYEEENDEPMYFYYLMDKDGIRDLVEDLAMWTYIKPYKNRTVGYKLDKVALKKLLKANIE